MKGGQKTVGVLYSQGFGLLKSKYKALLLITLMIFAVSAVIGVLLAPVQVVAMMPMQFMTAFALPFTDMQFDEFPQIDSIDPGFVYPDNIDPGLDDLFSPPSLADKAFQIVGVIVTVLFFVLLFLVWFTVIYIITLIRLMLTGTADVEAKRASLELAEGMNPSSDAAFKDFGKNWKRYLGITAWVCLWTTLWGMLLVVPGIVKGYSYRLAPYLVIQYPEMTVRQAMRKSIEITSGYKGRLFTLDIILWLFEIGAFAVGCCFFFVPVVFASILWISPLSYALFAFAYLDIKQAAIDKGLLPPADNCPVVPEADGIAQSEAIDASVEASEEAVQPAAVGSSGEQGSEFVALEEDSPEL